MWFCVGLFVLLCFFCLWTRPVGRVRFGWFLWFICCVIFVVFVGRGLDVGFRLVSISLLSVIRKCKESVCMLGGFGCSL